MTNLNGLEEDNRIRILHVDDDPEVLEVTKKILTMKGKFEVDCALSVKEAFKKLATKQYDIVVSDYAMPQKDGLDFLRELKKSKNELPFILFTGKGREEVAMKALNLGAEGYYDKQGSTETVFGELVHGIALILQRSLLRSRLKSSEEKFSKIFRNSPDAVFFCSLPEGKVLEANKATERLWGYPIEEIIGHNTVELGLWVDPEERKRLYKLLNENGRVENFVMVYRTKNGEIKTGIASAETLELSDGKYFQAIIRDVTEQKRAEENLVHSEERYRVLFETVIDGIMVSTAEGVVVSANPALASMFGYQNVAEFLTSPAAAHYVNPLDRQVMFGLLAQKGYVRDYEVKFKKKDGTHFDAMLSVIAQKDSQGTVIGAISIIRDITERKKAVAALVESEAKYRGFADSLPEIVFEADHTGKPTFVNKRAFEILGYSKNEIVKMNIFDFLVPEDRFRAKENAQRRMQGEETGSNKYTLQKKDGSILPIMVFSERIHFENGKFGLRGVMVNAYETKKDQERLEQTIADKTNELHAAQASLVKLERLAAIGELAGMVGHDLRNPLTGIKNAAYYLQAKQPTGLDDTCKKLLEIIDRGITHADKIVSDLQDYAREMQLELVNCSPRSILQEALTAVRIPDKVKIRDNTLDKPVIKADETKIARVFINIIKNAVDAMPEGGTLQIKSAQKDGNVEISFADTGIGMSKETLGKLFSPLVTTKAQGMGLGLAICKRMIDAHQGRITVQSVEGKGSTFTVILPIEPKLKDADEFAWTKLPESLS